MGPALLLTANAGTLVPAGASRAEPADARARELTELVRANGLFLEHVRAQTPELCMDAVRNNGMALRFVAPGLKSPAICLAAVQTDGLALEFVFRQFPEACLAAVRQDGRALRLVREQTPDICLAAVMQHGIALAYVQDQTPEFCAAAVAQNGLALRHACDQTEALCFAAVRQCAWALEHVHVRFQTPRVCRAAVEAIPQTFQFVQSPVIAEALREQMRRHERLECDSGAPTRDGTAALPATALATISWRSEN